jgi:hypothetical protein
MKRYRLHDLLRAAAATWCVASCSTTTKVTSGTVDAVAGDADSQVGDAAGQDSAGSDSKADSSPDTVADTLADIGLDAAPDGGSDAKADGGPDTSVDADTGSDVGETKVPFPCLDPQPMVAGQDTGVEVCKNGMIRRRAAKACPAYAPDPVKTCSLGGPNGPDQCKTDADCAQVKGGHCEPSQGGVNACFCQGSCEIDSDCSAGQVCLCGPKFGSCVDASCSSDADCAVGSCGTYTSNPGCGGNALACQTTADQCGAGSDCPSDKIFCTIANFATSGPRVCSGPMCMIGRPFEVAGAWRTAPAQAREDWHQDGPPSEDGVIAGLEVDKLPAELLESLAEYWLAAAQMEHASVASFARLTLELLAVGAPPDLLTRAQQAGVDEVRHAQICFSLAQSYGGRAIGPGPLAVDGSLRAPTLPELAAAAAREGCVWETAAALEASVIATQARDPVLAVLLRGIADDEARHAELAWDLVRWAVQSGGEPVRQAVIAALDDAVAALQAGELSPVIPDGHGTLTGVPQQALRRHAATVVIALARARWNLV